MDNSEIDLDIFLREHLVIDPDRMLQLSHNNGDYKHTTNAVKIRDYDTLFNDTKFLSMLNKSVIGRVDKIAHYLNTLKEINKATNAIEEELNEL